MTETTGPILSRALRPEPVAIQGRDPVPVTILTGFLGAGKTTLLNRILNGQHGLRVGVLVNDFGSVNIDAELVDGVEKNTISLTNGCVCCEIREDLVNSLEQLLGRAHEIDYVILESSGVGDPAGIVMTFLDQKFKGRIQLDSVTCVVDAEAVFALQNNEPLALLKIRQIAFADLVILNKVDLVSPKHVDAVRDWIGTHLNRIRIVEATRCDIPLEILLAVGRFNPVNMLKKSKAAKNGGSGFSADVFDTWSYETHRPMSLESLRKMVRQELPDSVYRCKGIVFAADFPDRRFALQIVGRRTEITELDEWGPRTAHTQIVAIGDMGTIDKVSLKELFDGCLDKPVLQQA